MVKWQMLLSALMEGKEKEVERLLTAYMGKTISIRDTFVRKSNQRKFLPWYSSWDFEFQDRLGGVIKSRIRNWI